MNAKEASSPAVQIAAIDPETATEYLELNYRNNRSIKKARVAAYASDMTAGNWTQTGDAVRFNIDGELVDGQHRMLAIQESGATIDMVVVTGLPMSAMRQIDTGATRRLSDALTIESFDNPHDLASSITAFMTYERYMADKFAKNSDTIRQRRDRNERPYARFSSSYLTIPRAFDLIDRRPSILESVKTMAPIRHTRAGQYVAPPMGVAALLHNVASYGEGTGSAIEYVEAVKANSGEGTDPAAQVNRLMMRSQKANSGNRGKLSPSAVAVVWFKGYEIWTGDAEPVNMRAPKYNSYPTIPGDVMWYKEGVA